MPLHIFRWFFGPATLPLLLASASLTCSYTSEVGLQVRLREGVAKIRELLLITRKHGYILRSESS